jgi:ribonuclease HII
MSSPPQELGESQAKREPLRELRRRARELFEASDEAGAIAFAQSLAGEPRAGARDLADQCRRRVEEIAAERARVETLFELRRGLFDQGHRFVAGVDEVGVGPLAGPVVAGAVILPEFVDLPRINDSKKLSPDVRSRLDAEIREQAVAVGIGEVSPTEIDEMNIFQASLEAMRRAVSALDPKADFLLVDARTVPGVEIGQKALIHGDAIDGSIAAASIIAKVYRDELMIEFEELHPGYGFSRHMGYGTAHHMEALGRLGASPIHRRSFSPVASAIRSQARSTPLFPAARP